MRVITLSQIKVQLGISTTNYDAALTALLPELDAKVKQITRRDWSTRVQADLTTGETEAVLTPLESTDTTRRRYSGRNVGHRDSLSLFAEFLATGQQIEATTGIPAESYLSNIIRDDYSETQSANDSWVRVELSAAATATDTIVATLGINIAYLNVIAKLAWWILESRSTSAPEFGAFVKRMGPVSINYGISNAKIDGKYGVPRWAIVGLPVMGRGH